MQCVVFKTLFDEKRKASKILLQEAEQPISMNRLFQSIRTGQRLGDDGLPLGCRRGEGVVEGEPDPDGMAQKVDNLFKFKKCYDQMDFNIEQRLAITKDIIKLIDPSDAQASLSKNHGRW